jgi:hypothetical protein
MLISDNKEVSMIGKRDDAEIEISVGPHPRRPHWSILRVTYSGRAEHEARVVAALAALVGPELCEASEDRPSGNPGRSAP